MADHYHPMLQRSINYTKAWETCPVNADLRPFAYKDKDGTWHIGYGHGNAAGTMPFVDEFTLLKDEAEAFDILVNDLKYLDPIMEKMLKGIEHNDNEYCALKDIAYNRGPGTLRNSAVMWWLRRPELKNYRKHACNAICHYYEGPIEELPGQVFPEFTKLDTSTDPVTKLQRPFLGLRLRRFDNASQFQLPMGPI